MSEGTVGTKRIAILGSTGSIGRNALEVVRSLGGDYRVTALSTHQNWELLAQQVAAFHPSRVAIVDKESYRLLKKKISTNSVEILAGEDSLEELASGEDVDFVLSAIVGAAALPATLAAIRQKKSLALANKEALVVAGEIVTSLASKMGVKLLPVDSEHSAIFQSLLAGQRSELRKVILTASGGPFREYPREALRDVTPEQALKHPTWQMGKKITIDSATLINKALEIIEAKWLFGLEAQQIDVVIHPQSIIHSMVEFQDGSVIAQMGLPDMKLPIQYALTYPQRRPAPVEPLSLPKLGGLTFFKPDMERFPALRLGYRAVSEGGTIPAVLNAANEVAVEAFLDRRIKLTDIVPITEGAMDRHKNCKHTSLGEILAADQWAREEARKNLPK
ncbi:MAG TPA: 1-deoxy-D-xylulose-5-phosphate reductoisomerase [Candidatus Brocadiales bacterium]|nr:1-deoxy-D-xylulose-5-phosphate reductoisomerase [Candidatus Brocadiales bacterium]